MRDAARDGVEGEEIFRRSLRPEIEKDFPEKLRAKRSQRERKIPSSEKRFARIIKDTPDDCPTGAAHHQKEPGIVLLPVPDPLKVRPESRSRVVKLLAFVENHHTGLLPGKLHHKPDNLGELESTRTILFAKTKRLSHLVEPDLCQLCFCIAPPAKKIKHGPAALFGNLENQPGFAHASSSSDDRQSGRGFCKPELIRERRYFLVSAVELHIAQLALHLSLHFL